VLIPEVGKFRRSKRNLSILGLAFAVISTGTFWLADSGSFALPAAPIPSGTAAGGAISSFTALVPSTVTIPQGQGAQIVHGIALGKVTVAAGFASMLRVDISWLDPKDAGAVLNNPNAWVSFGLYYPIHTGACTGGDPSGSESITDSVAICIALNTQGTGPLNNGGLLTISSQMLSGFILEAASDPASPPTCGATGSTWCAPNGTALNQNIFYVTASVNTPGGTPPGQQSQLTSLSYYISARPY